MSSFFSDEVMEEDRLRCEERSAKIAELEAEIIDLERNAPHRTAMIGTLRAVLAVSRGASPCVVCQARKRKK